MARRTPPRPSSKPTPPPPTIRTPRGAAFFALLKQVRVYPDLVPMRPALEGLDPRDGALAIAIYEAAVRRWGTLAFLFESTLGRAWGDLDEGVRAALLMGGAQLLFLDRVPAYAAIDETVELIKRGPAARAAGLVNAGLRGLTRVAGLDGGGLQRLAAWDDARDAIPLGEGGAVRLTHALLPEDAERRLSIACSVPRSVLATWREEHGEARARQIALHKLVPPTIVLNTQFAPSLPGQEPHTMLVAHDEPGCHVLGAEGSELTRVLRDVPGAWVQDASSAVVVRHIAQRAGELFGAEGPRLIVDLCAGNGTKTRHLARTFPHAKIIATDVDAERLATLRAMASSQASAMGNVQVVESEACERAIADAAHGQSSNADLVLLDVPCSNSGVLPRRPEATYRLATSQMERMTALQWEIVQRGISLVRRRGVIVYSTCSIERAENEAIVDRMERELGMVPLRTQRLYPTGVPGEAPTGYRDGAFHAMLRRE